MIYPEDLPLVKAALTRQAQGEPAAVETRIVRPDGKVRWIRVRSFPFKNGFGECMTSGIAEDITDRKQSEKERIAQMTLQRTTLIREVHHRIKNNLQGVAGLLRQLADEHPQVSPIIDRAIAQVQTVAVVHGLQGKALDNEIVLCEMVPTIARTVEAVLSSRPAIEVCVDVPQRIRVSEQESVSLALVLNELIMNSAKHASAAASEARIVITVRWDRKQRKTCTNWHRQSRHTSGRVRIPCRHRHGNRVGAGPVAAAAGGKHAVVRIRQWAGPSRVGAFAAEYL